MATTAVGMVAEAAVCVPMPRMAEGVQWCARAGTTGRVVVTLWRPDGIPADVIEAYRAGAMAQGTLRMDASVEEVVAAVGLSGRDVTAADLPGVAAAALAGFDRVGEDMVRRTANSTEAVLAGDAMPFEREQFAEIWPDPARLARCRRVVTALVKAGMTRPYVDVTTLVLPGDFDPLEV